MPRPKSARNKDGQRIVWLQINHLWAKYHQQAMTCETGGAGGRTGCWMTGGAGATSATGECRFRPHPSRLSRQSSRSFFETPRPLAIRIACATPESIACVAAFLCNHLAHGLAAFRTLRRTIGDDLRIALLQPRCGKPFRETARFAKLFTDGGYLPRKQCTRPSIATSIEFAAILGSSASRKSPNRLRIAMRYCTKSCRAFSPRSPS